MASGERAVTGALGSVGGLRLGPPQPTRLSPGDIAAVVAIDPTRPLTAAPSRGHNRWHASIPPVAHVEPGDIVAVETWDSGDAQVTPTSDVAAHRAFDLDRVHPLTGPLFIDGARPGDLLEVEILDLECSTFGWSALFAGGTGPLAELVEQDVVVKWRIADDLATSDDLPGVAIPAAPFVGAIGLAPSEQRRTHIEQRERVVLARGGSALQPSGSQAVPATPLVAREGLRTMPPRELGGNVDIKDLGPGARLLLPVDVPGALLSIGDAHFAQGDGETPGLAIEVAARIYLRCRLHPGGELRWRPTHPVVLADATVAARQPRPSLVTTGISVTRDGTTRPMDVDVAIRSALREMADYLMTARGYSAAQACVLVSVAADVRINALGNIPNAQASVALPMDIFTADASSADPFG